MTRGILENDVANTVIAGAQTAQAVQAQVVQAATQNDHHANVAAMDGEIKAAREKYAGELVAKHTTELPLPGGPPTETEKIVDVQSIARELNNVSDTSAREELTKATLGRLDARDQAKLKKTLGLPDSYNKSWGAAFIENTAVGRMIGNTGAGMQEGWGDRRVGIGPETEKWLRDNGVFNNRHSISLPQTINEVAIGGGSVIIDGAARTFTSVYSGGANFLGQLADEVGLGGGKQLAREINAMPEAFAGTPGSIIPLRRTPAGENRGTGPLRLPARPVLRNEDILIDASQGLQSSKAGVFNNVKMGTHGDPNTRYLWTVDERGINIAWEKTPFPTDRGNIVHTNVSSEASMAGEAWFGPNNTVTINADSGRFGYQSGAPKQNWDAAVRYWERLGYKVNVIPYGEK